jgi:diacylglycerol O-acyltransferase / wax synthase
MDPLDPFDVAMMAAELLSNPLHVAALLIMAPPPGDAGPKFVDRLYRDGLAGAAHLDPRLKRYPHRGVDTAGLWAWREVADVDVREHFQRRTLPSGAGRSELWQLVGELHAERLDRSKPMWMAYLIDGLEDDRFAFYVKVHHTVVDGVAGFQMISTALSTDPYRREMPPFFAAQSDRYDDRPAAPRGGLLPNPIPMVRSLVGAAASSVNLARRVLVGELANIVGSLTTRTAVAPFGAPHTRFNGRLGQERAVAAGSLSKPRIRAVQNAAGVSSNDVVTAVIAGALRAWLLEQDELPTRSLVAICPVTVRGRDQAADDEHGNQFGVGLCPLGTDLADPAERLILIHQAMWGLKRQVASQGSAATLLLLAPSVAPTVLLPMLPFTSWLRTGYNLPISNVPGPQHEMYWNGAHVEEIYPVSTVYDGMALNVTVCSYADRIGVGYVAGRDVLPDIDALIGLTEQSLAELEAALGVVAR